MRSRIASETRNPVHASKANNVLYVALQIARDID
jgi:hypothetical protein